VYQGVPRFLPRGMSTQFDAETRHDSWPESTFLDPAPIAAFLAAVAALSVAVAVVLTLIGVA
jgi:hypothetical protein